METVPFLDIYYPMGQRVLMAILCGTILGFEREVHGKSGGLRTTIIICLGATVFAYISELIHSVYVDSGSAGRVTVDPGRVSAQIITGIAFLGSGNLFNYKNHVIGLPSALSVWMTGAIGMFVGYGLFDWAIGMSFFTFLILEVDNLIDRIYIRTAKDLFVSVEFSSKVPLANILNEFLEPGLVYRNLSHETSDSKIIVKIHLTAEIRSKEAFERIIRNIEKLYDAKVFQSHGI